MLMLGRLFRYVVWVIGTLIGLNYLGIDLTSIALLGSALAVGLGFGLQHVVSNFVSGVIILLERSLKVGDFVELESGVRGHVSEIAMRYTRITSNDALDVVVPNSEFINGRVVNWTLGDAYRRMHIPFGVAYGTPKEMVREAGIAAARRIPGVMETDEKKSAVWLVAYGDSSMNYELVVWADRELTTRPGSAHANLMWALDDELHQRGIEIPFPQRDLHIRSGTLDVRMAAAGAPARHTEHRGPGRECLGQPAKARDQAPSRSGSAAPFPNLRDRVRSAFSGAAPAPPTTICPPVPLGTPTPSTLWRMVARARSWPQHSTWSPSCKGVCRSGSRMRSLPRCSSSGMARTRYWLPLGRTISCCSSTGLATLQRSANGRGLRGHDVQRPGLHHRVAKGGAHAQQQALGPGFVFVPGLAQERGQLGRPDHPQHLGRGHMAVEHHQLGRAGFEHLGVALLGLPGHDDQRLVERARGQGDGQVVHVDLGAGHDGVGVFDAGFAQHRRVGRVAAKVVGVDVFVGQLRIDDHRLDVQPLELAPQGAGEQARTAQQPAPVGQVGPRVHGRAVLQRERVVDDLQAGRADRGGHPFGKLVVGVDDVVGAGGGHAGMRGVVPAPSTAPAPPG